MTKWQRSLGGGRAVTLLVGCAVAPGLGERSTGGVRTQANLPVAGGFDWERAQRQQALSPARTLAPVPLPPAVDLRDRCSPVGVQGKLGACTGFALARGLREYLQRKNGEAAMPLSPLFLYFEERRMLGTLPADSGSTLTDGMAVLKQMGCAPEAAWPYDISRFAQFPPAEAYEAAAAWKVQSPLRLGDLAGIKQALARQAPVVLGLRVYASIKSVGSDGVIPMPQARDLLLGGHAVMIAGYDDRTQRLIVRNSWGPARGDRGYYYMPYAYVTPNLVHDIWTVLD